MGVDFVHGDVYNVGHVIDPTNMWTDDESQVGGVTKLWTEEAEKQDEFNRLKNRPEMVHVHLPDGDVFPITSSLFVIGKV